MSIRDIDVGELGPVWRTGDGKTTIESRDLTDRMEF
jgi:hypothetical protein